MSKPVEFGKDVGRGCGYLFTGCVVVMLAGGLGGLLIYGLFRSLSR